MAERSYFFSWFYFRSLSSVLLSPLNGHWRGAVGSADLYDILFGYLPLITKLGDVLEEQLILRQGRRGSQAAFTGKEQR